MAVKQFAKLFERNGEQVLVMMNQDVPGITVTFQDDGHNFYVSPSINYKVASNDTAASEIAWQRAEDTFTRFTEDDAFSMRAATLCDLSQYTEH